MKTFYSILSAILSPETGEKVSLGLVLSDGNSSIFKHSLLKISALKTLLPPEQFRFVKDYSKSIASVSSKVDTFSSQYSIYHDTDGKNIVFTEAYFEYLSVYSQNLLSFSKPVRIELPVSNDLFLSLFNKFIETKIHKPPKSHYRITRVRSEFFPTVQEYYSTYRELDNTEFSKIVIPVTVDLFGQNKIPVYAKFLDLERALNHIKSDFYDLKQLHGMFRKSQGFVVTYEPHKERFPQQHYAWQHLHRAREFEYIDLSEVEKIREYAVQHDVRPC